MSSSLVQLAKSSGWQTWNCSLFHFEKQNELMQHRCILVGREYFQFFWHMQRSLTWVAIVTGTILFGILVERNPNAPLLSWSLCFCSPSFINVLPLKLVRKLILSTHETLLPRLVQTKKLMHVNGTFILIILIRIYIGFKIQIRILCVQKNCCFS
jgi:hypothetical protein